MPIISQHHLALKASSVRFPKRAMTCCGETLCVHRKCLKMRSARGLHHSQFVNGHRTAGGGTSEFVSGRESSRCARPMCTAAWRRCIMYTKIQSPQTCLCSIRSILCIPCLSLTFRLYIYRINDATVVLRSSSLSCDSVFCARRSLCQSYA